VYKHYLGEAEIHILVLWQIYSGQQMPNFCRNQSRSQTRRCGGCEQMYPIPPRGSGGRDPRIFFVYF